MTVSDLHNIINGDFSKVKKDVGMLLVDNGFMNYKKLTEKNYDYWWYEVSDITKINKKNFTYDWNDLVPTRKFSVLEKYLPYHEGNESIFTILNNVLQIISCGNEVDISTGERMTDVVFNMLYGGRIKSKEKSCRQLSLFDEDVA